jgi:hypothetical protein
MKNALAIVAAGGLLLAGCSGRLETSPYKERTDKLGAALKGTPYALPKLQYQVKLTRWLMECPNEIVDGKPTALKFKVDVSATPATVPGEAYTVDYSKLDGPMRTSNFEIKYWPNGTLKSIGAGADDKTGEVVKDVVKAALAAASAMAGVPPVPVSFVSDGTRAVSPASVVCERAALALVQQARAESGKIESYGEDLKKIQKAIERIQSRAALKLINKQDREALLTLFDAIDTKEAQIAAATKELDRLKGLLGVTQEFVWNSDMGKSATAQLEAIGLTGKEATKLGALLTMGNVAPLTGDEKEADAKRRDLFASCFNPKPDVDACVAEQLNLHASVHLMTALPDCAKGVNGECVTPVTSTAKSYRDARDAVPDSGVFVREPVQGRLVFCRAARLMKPSAGSAVEKGQKREFKPCTTNEDEAKLELAYFPQLGQLRYLPLRVGPFQARELALSLTTEGRIESFSYKSTKAAAAGAAASLADMATQIDAALEKRETEKRDDLTYAMNKDTKAYEAEIARLTKENELKKLRNPTPAAVDPLKPVKDETAVVQTEVELLKALYLREKLKAQLAGQGS